MKITASARFGQYESMNQNPCLLHQAGIRESKRGERIIAIPDNGVSLDFDQRSRLPNGYDLIAVDLQTPNALFARNHPVAKVGSRDRSRARKDNGLLGQRGRRPRHPADGHVRHGGQRERAVHRGRIVTLPARFRHRHAAVS